MVEDWAVTSKATGEVQFVKVGGGARPSSHGYPSEDFTAHKLHREPHEDDTYDGKRIERCPVKASRRERLARIGDLDRGELLDLVEQLIDSRLEAHGLIGGTNGS